MKNHYDPGLTIGSVSPEQNLAEEPEAALEALPRVIETHGERRIARSVVDPKTGKVVGIEHEVRARGGRASAALSPEQFELNQMYKRGQELWSRALDLIDPETGEPPAQHRRDFEKLVMQAEQMERSAAYQADRNADAAKYAEQPGEGSHLTPAMARDWARSGERIRRLVEQREREGRPFHDSVLDQFAEIEARIRRRTEGGGR